MGKKQKDIVRALAMVTQLGISLLAPIVLCAAFGNWIDAKLGWSVTAVLLILGVMAGARNAWLLVKEAADPGYKRRLKDEKESK